MLKFLHIENIAVIEQTDIEFTEGFNVLTGETGAGKSIIIDAINAVLGERTSKDLIRNGCSEASVSAIFCNLSEYSLKVLSDNGYSVDQSGNLHIMRKLTNSGSTVRINGQPATAGILKLISKSLINIHGQHDNQDLLNPESHYIYIDRIADNGKILSEYYDEFHHLNKVRKELSGYETDEADKLRETELLKYQIKELTDADIKIGEIEEIKSKLQIAKKSEKIEKSLKTAYSYLNGDELTDGAFSAIRNAQKEISACEGDNFKDIGQEFSEVLTYLDSLTGKIRQLINNKDEYGCDIEFLMSRLDLLRRVTLKYGGSEQSAKEFLNTAVKRLDDIEMSDKKIIELSAELDASTERLINKGKLLTASRKKAALKFEKDVTEILRYLDMPSVVFSVKTEQGRYTKTGCDNIEFMICTNAGETLKPLSKIASGGELSRVMLAIKRVISKFDDVDTLIFDEIDTGISGRAAQKVGNQLKLVSENRQTICVTHLAQIAAFAGNHLLIEKSVDNDRTFTVVTSLKGEARVAEIARIMAGSQISENIYKSARELLERNF